jgi:hypothetical protein
MWGNELGDDGIVFCLFNSFFFFFVFISLGSYFITCIP